VNLEERIPKLKQRRKQKANKRLIIYLSIFFLLIVGVVYFQSSLSKVASIKVIGTQNIVKDEIIQYSKLSIKSNFWNINHENIENNIKDNPEVKTVMVERKLPNIVIIKVEEYQRIAYIENNRNYFPVLENGNILRKNKNGKVLLNAPVFINWAKGEDIQEMVAQLKELPKSIINSISEIHYTPIPTDTLQITLFMNDGNEVKASIRNFFNKMQYYPSMVKELGPNVKGIFYIDVENRFTPYGVDVNEGAG
jgi:cell division protein FtsQ